VNSKRKLKQKKRRAEKRSRRTEESSVPPAEALLARIGLERRVRHEQSSQRFREEEEQLWLAEERQRARRKVEGRRQKAKG
jgi:hypothetical protein